MRRIEDLSPADYDTRVQLRTALTDRRRQLQLSQYDVADRLGVGQPVVQRFEKQLQWKMSTLSKWARALNDATVRYELVGFPEPWHVHGIYGHNHECPDGPAAEVERWHRSRAIADAIGVRNAAGVRLSRLADLFGCTEPTVSGWEDIAEDDTRLPNLQRYVRGTAILGRLPEAYLTVDLVDIDRKHPDPTNIID